MNNVIVGTGQAPAGSTPIQNQPPTGWSNNVVTTGTVTLFTDAGGTNPNFTPAAGATELLGKGASGAGVPTTDIGFDPKCLVKRAPVMVGSVASESWWQYDIDVDYIKSIGGVAKCFNAGARATNDIGSYKTGAIATITAGTCKALTDGGAGGAGTGGGVSNGGASVTAGTTSGGGASSVGGTDGAAAGSGSSTAGNASSSGGSGPGSNGGSVADGTGNGASTAGSGPAADAGGCGCRLVAERNASKSWLAFGLVGLSLLAFGRRRRAR
jgi:MYXO-CTERM domain-containing protein